MPNNITTYPHQRTIKIHRETAKTDFLGIKNENWQAASRDLGAHALRLYLYLASNADGFNLALSQRAAERDIGIPRSTYYDQFRVLENKGYLKHLHGNTYEFFETPQPRDRTSTNEFSDRINFTADEQGTPPVANSILSEDRETNNNYPTTNVINNRKNPIEEVEPEEENNNQSYIKSGSFYF